MNPSPPFGNMVFCSVSKGENLLFSYNGGNRELEELASVWLQQAPNLHVWYLHTAERRTFGFLMEDGYTYFAITEPSKGNIENLAFLKQLRDGFMKVSNNNNFHAELTSVIRHLISTEGTSPSPTKSRKTKSLELNCGTHDRKKPKDKVIEFGGCNHQDNMDRGLKIDLAQESPSYSTSSLRRSLSLKTRAQQHARKLWWRHVKIAIAVDALLCLVLFLGWLAVCRGFQCLS